jgi:hypothetical protein
LGNNSDVSNACRRLNLNFIRVSRSLFVSGFVRKCKLVIIASSNVCVIVVNTVILYS